jgi:hypothetical protein
MRCAKDSRPLFAAWSTPWKDVSVEGEPRGRNPSRTGPLTCCARAARGHAAAAPPTSDMNSRRFTASDSRASHRNDSTPRHGRLLHPSTWAVRDDRGHAADNFLQGGSPKQATPLTAPATSDMNSPWVPAAASLERLLDCTGEREQTLLAENGRFAAAHASRQC